MGNHGTDLRYFQTRSKPAMTTPQPACAKGYYFLRGAASRHATATSFRWGSPGVLRPRAT